MPKGYKREMTKNSFNLWFICEKNNILIESNTPSGFKLKLKLHKKMCKECNNVIWNCEDVSKNDFSNIKKNHIKKLKNKNICQSSYEL